MIDSEGYVFCQKLKSEGINRIHGASACVHKLTNNVLARVREIEISPYFFAKCLPPGVLVGSFFSNPSQPAAMAGLLEATSLTFEHAAKKDKDLELGANFLSKISLVASALELGTLYRESNGNHGLFLVVLTAKLLPPMLNHYALKHNRSSTIGNGELHAGRG